MSKSSSGLYVRYRASQLRVNLPRSTFNDSKNCSWKFSFFDFYLQFLWVGIHEHTVVVFLGVQALSLLYNDKSCASWDNDTKGD